MYQKSKLTLKEECILSWWVFVGNSRAGIYYGGIKLGWAKRFAFKRAKRYGNN